MIFRLSICLLLLVSTLATAAETKGTRNREKGLFEFRDGDRVVFLGSGFIERLQNTGYLETMLTAAMPSKNITFRNLGWSGDTVWGDARAVFGSRADGFKRLLSDVAICKPTVLIVCYGENEAYAGEAGLEEFRRGFNTLLDSLEATGARIVLLGPRQHEKMPPPLPDPAKYNADLRKYNDVIGDVAKEREHTFIDLYDLFNPATIEEQDKEVREIFEDAYNLTENGIYLSDYGNSFICYSLAQELGARFESRVFSADAATKSYDARGITVSRVDFFMDGTMLLEGTDRCVPISSSETSRKSSAPRTETSGFLKVTGLPRGFYTLMIDGKKVKDFTEYDLQHLRLAHYVDPVSKALSNALRKAINEKNTLFFHRYRPQNETYLFLFRKHEQGNNAVEIPQFDPLIAELEKKIAELKQPVKQKYELIKVK